MSAKHELEELLRIYRKLLELDLLLNPFLSNPPSKTPSAGRSIELGSGVSALRLANGETLVSEDDGGEIITLNKEQIKQLLALSLNLPTPAPDRWTIELSPSLQCHCDKNNNVVLTEIDSTHYPSTERVADLAANLMWLL